MGKFISVIVVIGIIAAVLIFGGAFYIVDESEQVVITQFGKPVGEPITTPGLKIKKPFLETANYFDKRFLAWDGEPKQVSTRDKRFININTYARWRISDPLTFFKAAKNERNAQSRLDDVIDGIVRDEISNRNMEEIIRSSGRSMETYEDEPTTVNTGARSEIIQNILDNVTLKLADLKMGIEVLDVQLKRIDYNKQVQSKLFNRMISEQNMIAEEYRGQGQGRKQTRLGEQIRDEKKILSNIFKKELRTKDDFNEIIALINKYKIIQECYQKAQHYINLASNSLSVFKDSEEKNILKRLTSFSLSRNF